MERRKVLITGGAGYVGSCLLPQLLNNGYEVTILDRLLWGGDHLIPSFTHPNVSFVFGDIRDESTIRDLCKSKDTIIHLASIVGYPACDMNPRLAVETNVEGSRNIAKNVSRNQHVVFASSGSNYGRVLEGICTEETALNPITLYSKTKTEAELILMNETNCTALRPGTAFGISPRLRLDLLVHQLTIQAVKTKNITLYEANAVRPFFHVSDFGQAILLVMEKSSLAEGEVYNLGTNDMNFTKRQIAEAISKETECKIIDDQMGEDPDKRTYQVSYDKIEALGFKSTRTIRDGIQEIIRVMPLLVIKTPYANANLNI